jgi:N-acetylmuramoyl-L-alanine amidase
VPRSRRAGPTSLLLGALILLLASGCAGSRPAIAVTRIPGDPPPASSFPITVDPPTTPTPAALPPPVPIPAPEDAPPFPVATTPAATNVVPPAPPTPPPTNWVRLDSWTARHPGVRPEIRAGSKLLRVGGVTTVLAFEPLPTSGSVLLHPLDVAKNLDPLTDPAPPWRRKSIVLDPGHGGINAGTRIITGNRFEKEFTLDWARRLKPLLEAKGWSVTLTRTNDVDLSLPDRVRIAEASGAELFVSLHFNSAFPSQTAEGLETYCLTPTGMPSTITRQYADDPSSRHPNNRFDAENVRLAWRIHRSLLGSVAMKDRGIRRARFMDVLRGQGRPAVLVEGGYLSNPEEARRIATPEYRQRLAVGVAKAFD